LLELGLREGSSNTHPGQGTENRRFFFANFYLELMWVSDEAEVQSEGVAPTNLWQRWSGRSEGVAPFGAVFRRSGPHAESAPFSTWSYRPPYLPPGLSIEVANDVPLAEPGLFYLPFVHRAGPTAEPTDHGVPITRILGVVFGLPDATALSPAAAAAQANGLIGYRAHPSHLLEILFAAEKPELFDLRPTLPLVLRGVAP